MKWKIALTIFGLFMAQLASGQTNEPGMINHLKLQQLLDKTVDNKKVFGTVLAVQSGAESWSGAAGNLSPQSQFFIASTTKLYTTAIILKLKATGQLRLEDKISVLLGKELLAGLHIYKGVDYADSITIKHLLSQTSGLPDYFEEKRENGTSLNADLSAGNDQQWTCGEAVASAKKMTPHFVPGQKGKAYYSDTNYQLLGRVIEIVTGKSYNQALIEYIFDPLQLKHTYLYQDSRDTKPALMYFKTNPLSIPLAMTSFGPDGGIVSTADELLIFLNAFFTGKLFPTEYLAEMQHWNRIFFPLQYGVGMMRFQLPRIFTLFKSFPALIGHSGLSGAFAYYCPERNLFLTGTVNQISHPDISYKLMIKILSQF